MEKIKLLLVDDEQEFVETLAIRLKNRNFIVDTALDANGALEKLKKCDFDVIILDVLMPGMDGLQALNKIKALQPLTEVLILSGHSTAETAVSGLKSGAFGILMKPLNIDDLVGKISMAHTRKLRNSSQAIKENDSGM